MPTMAPGTPLSIHPPLHLPRWSSCSQCLPEHSPAALHRPGAQTPRQGRSDVSFVCHQIKGRRGLGLGFVSFVPVAEACWWPCRVTPQAALAVS